MNRDLPLEIRKGKVNAPVSAVGRAKQTEERLVLIDGQQLPVTQRPTFGGEAKTENSDFREKWFCHVFLLLGNSSKSRARKDNSPDHSRVLGKDSREKLTKDRKI
jgi:hypothetical protein